MKEKKVSQPNDLLYRISNNKINATIKRMLKAIIYNVSTSIRVIYL